MEKIYTVAQINTYVKNLLYQDYFLKKVTVKGEVSNCKYHSSGHIYFTLKDEKSAIACVMFAGSRAGLSFKMKDGDQVEVTGSVEIYESAGKYQLYARTIKQAGLGDLYVKFEQLKKELAEMGMFSPEYKKPIPKYATKVGIVTASTGAAIRDIENISRRRNPYVQLILYPSLVQGDGAAASIIKGIRYLNSTDVDVIIVGRGGGSMEDLWCFNDENVARAIFESEKPIVSAVGHEIDWTIADYVADLRAPTPSAAAELVVFDYYEFEKSLDILKKRMESDLSSRINVYRLKMKNLEAGIMKNSPERRLNEMKYTSALLLDRLNNAIDKNILNTKNKIRLFTEKVDSCSPSKKLKAGFAYVENDKKEKVSMAANANKGDRLKMFFQDGYLEAVVDAKEMYERNI